MFDFHYLNGRWVTTDEMKISAFDITVLRGFGIFDFLRTYNRHPFKLKEHITRLFNSAKILGITVPESQEEITQKVFQGIKKNKDVKELNIRIVVTGGISIDSVTPGESFLLIMFTPAVDYPKSYYRNGVSVITVRLNRTFAEAKTLNYLNAIFVLKEAKKKGAVEALYVDKDGNIHEGTTTNFFAVVHGRLITPKRDILYGITRKIVLELSEKLHTPAVEENLFLDDLSSYREAFITASNKEIMPVVKIDGLKVGNGKVGDITKKLMFEYNRLKQAA